MLLIAGRVPRQARPYAIMAAKKAIVPSTYATSSMPPPPCSLFTVPCSPVPRSFTQACYGPAREERTKAGGGGAKISLKSARCRTGRRWAGRPQEGEEENAAAARARGVGKLPPWASASFRAIASPSPVPPTSGGVPGGPVERLEDPLALRRRARRTRGRPRRARANRRHASRREVDRRARGRVLVGVLDEVHEDAQRVHEVEPADEQRAALFEPDPRARGHRGRRRRAAPARRPDRPPD